MTDSENDVEGLPTALVREEDGALFSYRHTNLVDLNDGDELVCRKDVKNLIQDKIRQAEEKIEENNAFNRLNRNDAKARKQELESLLEDLEQ